MAFRRTKPFKIIKILEISWNWIQMKFARGGYRIFSREGGRGMDKVLTPIQGNRAKI